MASPAVRVLPMGDAALLIDVSDIEHVLALESRLEPLVASGHGAWAEVEDLVPAARTLMIVARPGTDLRALAAEVRAVAAGVGTGAPGVGAPSPAAPAPPATRHVEIRVRYDGPDLADVARFVGLTVAEVIAAHTGTPWQVGFGGFTPGFAYLVGGDPRLEVPRHADPRAHVPAGAVGLAGHFSGIYPRESPGGWRLLGTTDVLLWDPDRDPPALLVPGTTVQFVPMAGR